MRFLEGHPIASFNVSFLDSLAVGGDKGGVVGQLGVDVDPQGVGGRRLDELVIRQVGAQGSSGNYMSQKDLVFVMAIG